MRAAGRITMNEEKYQLSPAVDAGNAVSHRAYRPTRDHLATMMDTIENLLHRLFVLPKNVKALKKATPQRRKER